jgi:triphosphatase
MGADGNWETEIKFATDSAGLALALNTPLFASASPFQLHNLRSIYFDTSSGDLRKRKIILRIRESAQNRNALCFKYNSIANDNLFQRIEVEVTSPDLQPDIALFDKKTRAALVEIIDDRALERQFEIQIKRRTTIVKHQSSEIEIALDDGCIIIGEGRFPLTEIELELKSGEEPGLYDFAIKLASELPLRLDFISKSEKADYLRGYAKASPMKAMHLELERNATLDDAIAASISNELIQFVENWAALRESDDSESIHQMRIALRHMRSALAMFKRDLPRTDFESLGEDAKHIANKLGRARACDVLRKTVELVSLANPNTSVDLRALLTPLQEMRNTSYSDARAVINDRQTTLFVLNVQQFLANRGWKSIVSGTKKRRLFSSAKDFAADALRRLRMRVLKRGALLKDASDSDLHKLRIALKDLRYGSRLFSKLFNCERKFKSYDRAAADLLVQLGVHNDFVGAKYIFQQLAHPLGLGTEKATGFIIGWLASEDALNSKERLKTWKKFKRTRPNWK